MVTNCDCTKLKNKLIFFKEQTNKGGINYFETMNYSNGYYTIYFYKDIEYVKLLFNKVSYNSNFNYEFVKITEDELNNLKDEFKEYFIHDKIVLFEACGHNGVTSFSMDIWGNKVNCCLKEDQIENRDGNRVVAILLCPNCKFEQVKKTAIRCGLCGLGIMEGESVALYGSSSRGIKKELATYIEGNVFGCLRINCCPSGAFFAGYWTEDGFKPAFGGLTVVEEVFRTGKPIIGNL